MRIFVCGFFAQISCADFFYADFLGADFLKVFWQRDRRESDKKFLKNILQKSSSKSSPNLSQDIGQPVLT